MNAHKKTDLILEEVEEAYEKFYKKKQVQIKKDFDSYFKQFTKQDEKKRLQVERGELTEKEYNLWRKRKMAQGKEYKRMQERIAIDLYNVNQIATQYVNDRLAEVYSVNYNAVEGATMQLKGYSFNLVNEKVVKALAEEDKSLLPFKQLDPDKDIPWNMRNINNAISEGIRKGESIPEISKRIYGDVAKDTTGLKGKELKSVLKKNKEASVRSARTIVTGAENKARLDSYHQLEKDGVILDKVWIATIDGRTRDWHAELDGQAVGIDEPFQNSVGDIMFPGDPSAKPSNVYNCRCSMKTKLLGFKKTNNTKKEIADDTIQQTSNTTNHISQTASVSNDAKQGVEYYVSGDGMYINHYLRDGQKAIEQMGEMRDSDKKLIKQLDEATKLKHNNSILYRSVDASAVFGEMSDLDFMNLQNAVIYNDNSKFAQSAKQRFVDKSFGKIVPDKGFMSTTKSIDVAIDFRDFTGSDKPIVIEFTNADKVNGFDLGKIMPDLEEQMEQQEVLLERNLEYIVKDVKKKEGNIWVVAEFVKKRK